MGKTRCMAQAVLAVGGSAGDAHISISLIQQDYTNQKMTIAWQYDNDNSKQMAISNTNVFSKTGSSSDSCTKMAMSQCSKKHRKYVVLHGLPYTCSSQTARHNSLPSNCLPSSTDTELMSEWLSTSPCYSMPWIRLPKLQCQAKHL